MADETWGKTFEAWVVASEASSEAFETKGKTFLTRGKAFETRGKAFQTRVNTNRLCGRCWNGSSVAIQTWFISSEASGRGLEGWSALPQASNTMDLAWFTLTQARNALTQTRNALVEARYAAYEAWPRMGAGGCVEV
jgi:hypothetical protein